MPIALEVTTPSDREIRVTRRFDAAPELVFVMPYQTRTRQKVAAGTAGVEHAGLRH